MAQASSQFGSYRPNRKKTRKHGPRRTVLRPIKPKGPKPKPMLSPLSPFAPGGSQDLANQAAMNALPSTVATKAEVAAGKAPAPGKPLAPVQPLDPDVVNAQVTARRNVGLGDLYATWQQGNLDQEFGFGAGGAANPYSKAKLLEESFRRSKLGTLNSYAAAGKRNTGLYGAAQNENARQYDIGYDQLRRAYDQASGETQFGRLQNYADAGTGVDETTFQSLLKQLGGL